MSPIFAVLLVIMVSSVTTTENTSYPPWIIPPQITACGPNGVWSGCTSKCEPKCSNYKENLLCTDECVKGCRCNKGYLLDDASGLCILPQYCNKIVQKPKNGS